MDDATGRLLTVLISEVRTTALEVLKEGLAHLRATRTVGGQPLELAERQVRLAEQELQLKADRQRFMMEQQRGASNGQRPVVDVHQE